MYQPIPAPKKQVGGSGGIVLHSKKQFTSTSGADNGGDFLNKIIDDVIALNKHMETRKETLNMVSKRSDASRVDESVSYHSERNVKDPIKINNHQ
jgi:hypothetical protein